MKRKFRQTLCVYSVAAIGAVSILSISALGSLDRGISAVSDSEWEKILAEKGALQYEIKQGDTLADISNALFGSAKYWPKIWAANQDRILNPHQIKPGVLLAFNMGSSTQLPSLQLSGQPSGDPKLRQKPRKKTDEEVIAAAIGPKKPRKKEWMHLPLQNWEEEGRYPKPVGVDQHGIDMNSRIRFGQQKGLELPYNIQSEKIQPLGELVAARNESNFPSLKDIIYIRPDGELQVGSTYGLTQEPFLLKSRKSDRVGFSYKNSGQVKIIGVKDGLFVGSIESLKDPVFRGSKVIPLPQRIPTLTAVAGPKAMEAIMTLDKTVDTYATAQFKQVFIDKGKDDGLAPGMIFRAYQYFDPATDKRITNSDFIIEGEVMVVACTEEYSSGIVLSSKKDLLDGSLLVLQTDVSEYLKSRGVRERPMDDGSGNVKRDPLDDLDQLEGTDRLGKDEEKELKQLENWEENPEEDLPAEGLKGEQEPVPEPVQDPVPETAPLPDQSAPEAQQPLDTDTVGASGAELPPPPPDEDVLEAE